MAKGDAGATGAFYVIEHDAVGPVQYGWLKGRVIGPDDQPGGDIALTDAQWARLVQIGAIRAASADEQQGYADAQKRAADAGTVFADYYAVQVPEAAAVAETAPVAPVAPPQEPPAA